MHVEMEPALVFTMMAMIFVLLLMWIKDRPPTTGTSLDIIPLSLYGGVVTAGLVRRSTTVDCMSWCRGVKRVFTYFGGMAWVLVEC